MTFQIEQEEGLYYRQTLFDKAKRVVVKVGSVMVDTSIKTKLKKLEKNMVEL